MKIAFLTAGGIAPCLSSSIGALIESYNNLAPEAEMIGYLNGYRGLLLGKSLRFPEEVKINYPILYDFGGSIIGNSRVKFTNTDGGGAPGTTNGDMLRKTEIQLELLRTNSLKIKLIFYIRLVEMIQIQWQHNCHHICMRIITI